MPLSEPPTRAPTGGTAIGTKLEPQDPSAGLALPKRLPSPAGATGRVTISLHRLPAKGVGSRLGPIRETSLIAGATSPIAVHIVESDPIDVQPLSV